MIPRVKFPPGFGCFPDGAVVDGAPVTCSTDDCTFCAGVFVVLFVVAAFAVDDDAWDAAAVVEVTPLEGVAAVDDVSPLTVDDDVVDDSADVDVVAFDAEVAACLVPFPQAALSRATTPTAAVVARRRRPCRR
jgi:hypothetical protein